MLHAIHGNGIGIAPEYTDRVFNLFEVYDKRVGGTGVGLALVKKIIIKIGGNIWAESEGLGKCSTIFLPTRNAT